MSSVNSDDEQPQRWVPTHVQVTVLRGRDLRGKGKNGTSDVYTIIQVGKEKYSTCVVEKTTSPEWKEECSFELLPGVLEEGGRGAYPPGSCDLVLTVMHRALIGLDVFLGQAVIPLDKAFQDHIYAKTEAEWVNLRSRWFRLNSKTGKKEKERGEVQATVQFTRNNLTASMYHLAMKDKSHSAFSKLKERMRGKKRSSVDDDAPAPAPPPSSGGGGGGGGGSLPRTRLPSDGGGEEEYEDDEGGEGRRNKMRTFFLRGKLRKSSETRSSTSLGSESSESSSRGGSLSPTAGISVVVSDLSNSPSNSSNLTADNSPEHTADTSPKLSPDDSEFGDDCHEISIAVPALYRNGGVHHAYHAPPPQPGPGGPLAPAPAAAAAAAVTAAAKASPLGLGLLLKPLPTSLSLQNISPREEELPRGGTGGAGDGRRWSFDKPGEDEKAAIAAALEKSGPMVGDDEEEEEEEGRSRSAAPPGATGAARESYDRKQQKKKGDSGGRVGSEAAPQEKTGKGWFGSKECSSKPSPRVSPKLGPIPESHSPPLPSVPPPSQHPSWGSWAPPAPPESTPPGSPLHPTNPFCHSQCSPPPTPMSPSNPFFSTLQQNPFSGAAFSDPPLTPWPPPLPYLSSARPPIAHLFSQDPDPVPGLLQERPSSKERAVSASDATAGGEALARLKRRPLPPPPPGKEEEPPNGRSPNPFNSSGTAAPEVEWDDPFEAFVSCRLQTADDAAAGSPQQPQDTKNGPALKSPKGSLVEFWHPDKEELPKSPDPLKDSDVVQAFPPQPADVCLDTAPEPWSDGFAQFLTAIPITNQNASMLLTASLDSSKNHDRDTVTNLANPSSNTDCLTHTTSPRALCPHCQCEHNPSIPCEGEKLKDCGNSSDPSSSGVGSLAEEDVLSSISSCSEKWPACWGEGVETKSVLNLSEESPEQTVVGLLKDSEDKPIDWSCPVVTDHEVEGDLIQVSDQNEKPQSMVDDLVDDDQVLDPLPLISLQHGDGPSKEAGPAHVPLSDLSSKPTNTSIPPDLELEATVSTTGGSYELQESLGDLHEPENLVLAADGDEESVTPHLLETEGTSTCPSFHTVTSFLGDESSFLEMPFGAGSLDGQLVHQSSPKTPRLLCPKDGPTMTAPLLVFNESSLVEGTLGVSGSEEQLVFQTGLKPPEHLDVIGSRTSPSPDQAFDHPLPSGRWLCPSPGSLLSSSLYGSADSQHYLTCLTHNSSAATSASGDSLVERRTSENLWSSVSTLCGAESCDEPSQVLFPENVSAPGREGGCGAADVDGEAAGVGLFPSEETRLAKELEACLEPGSSVKDFGSHSDTPIQTGVDSVVNRNHGNDDRLAGGTQQDEGAPSEDTPPAPSKTECPPTLQRSHSEGAMATGLSGRTLTSFGSDPSVVPSLHPNDPSGAPDSTRTPFLLLLLSPTSCLPAEPPAPLARRSLPSASVDASLPLPTATPGPAPEAPPPPEEAHATGVAHASDEPNVVQRPEVTQEKVERPRNSPHPVRPLTPGSQGPEERRGPEGRSVLEKLRCTIQPGRSSQLSEAEPERRKSLTEGAGSYYHLTHNELVALLVRREADLERQKAEFERQTALLSRREVELRRLKPQVRDLENYIDTLLVRIMEQTPTLLQVSTTKFK